MWIPRAIGPSPYLAADILNQFFGELHERIRLRRGVLSLTERQYPTPLESVGQYLLECPGEQFLDVIEDIFQIRSFVKMHVDPNKWVAELNDLFRADDLPYFLTQFVTDINGRQYRVASFPKVIMRDSELLHANAIGPALRLLQNPIFQNANNEFLEGLEDYRKSDFDDCLVKCGSSFESVMKVICDQKRWPFKETDTAAPLIKIIMEKTAMASYFETLLMIVATLRNKISSAHGAGPTAKHVPPHIAKYAINVTASAIILLVEQAGIS